jgi:hypothetical protein
VDRSMGEYNRKSDCSRIAHDVTVALSYIRTRRFMKGIPCKKRLDKRVLQPRSRVAGQDVAYGKVLGTCFHGIRSRTRAAFRETQFSLDLISRPFACRNPDRTAPQHSFRWPFTSSINVINLKFASGGQPPRLPGNHSKTLIFLNEHQ